MATNGVITLWVNMIKNVSRRQICLKRASFIERERENVWNGSKIVFLKKYIKIIIYLFIYF
jgi:hypothetical protein